MDREEPRLGAPNLSEIDFRRGDRRTIPTPARDANLHLWWQIAVGVFLGMLLHSVVIGIYARWETEQALKAMHTDLARFQRAGENVVTPPAARRPAPPAPLAPDQRCIKGERFKRVSNGWNHLPRQPC